jgi:hypothetical protein
MTTTQTLTGYSADVQMDLLIAGQRIHLAQIGPGRLVFDHPILLPATTAEVILLIDGHPRRWSAAITPSTAPSRIVQAEFSDAA